MSPLTVQIAELEAQLDREKKARVQAENQLKTYQSNFYKGGSTEQ